MIKRSWLTACAVGLLALTCTVAVAQERNDRNDQNKQSYRQFNDKQRQYANDYYSKHRDSFKNDRDWNGEYENKLRPGYVLDPDMRRMSRPAPPDLLRGMGPAPRGYRYVVIGGHVVLVDDTYRVHDAIHFDINIGH